MMLLETPPGQHPTSRIPSARLDQDATHVPGVSHARHDDELGAGTDEDIQRALSQNLEVVGGQGQAMVSMMMRE